EAAKQFAMQAAVLSQNPPHDATTWQEVVKLWEEAIARLEEIASDNPGYLEAQSKLAQYKTNLAQVQIRLQAELDSVEALEVAQRQIEQFIASIPQDGSPADRNFLLSELQSIINQLSKVKPGTTASQEAQQLQQFAQGKLQELQ
ncbi:MAG: hypothetical protein HC925_06060, partial [Coleofasciculaceae cyanobacterium SM2_3_26]|nr:hypothetical protein [Coleofasciculaceae cyanobacterium SM2_3_26]